MLLDEYILVATYKTLAIDEILEKIDPINI